jgi:hypothetical protein
MSYRTPVLGLGCSSGPYLIYASAATLGFACHVAATQLCPYVIDGNVISMRIKVAEVLSSIGSIIAVVNTGWLLTLSILQSTNVYINIWCASCALQTGGRFTPKSWVPLLMTDQQVFHMAWKYWGFSTLLAAVAVVSCGFFFCLNSGDDNYKKKTDCSTVPLRNLQK